MTLTTDYGWHDLPLATPFAISRATTAVSGNVVVRIEDGEGRAGIGGAAPSEYYGETRETVEAVLPELLAVVEDVGDPHQLQRVEDRMRTAVGGPRSDPAARAAVSIALHDLVCKRLGLPLYRYWGLDPERTLTSSFTVGLDDTDRMAEKAAEAAETYPVLKLKLGTDRDREIVQAVREAAPGATLRVDANGAWDPERAVELTAFLADQGVEFVEQPVAADDLSGLARVREEGALPVAADESCVTLADVPRVADVADIAVLKLSKCGGIRAAVQMIHAARAHELAVMLGCMAESNASIAAAAHLAPLADYADLDGSLLLAVDPFAGVPMPDGRIDIGALDRPGTGARAREN